MKKFVIGFAVLGLFALYSVGIRHKSPVLSQPSSLAGNTAATTTGNSNATSGTTSVPPRAYKNGTYTGSVADAYYGNLQVNATISAGKITKVTFLQYPDTHGTSVAINQQAMPYLQQEAIQSQTADVQIISGATFTSQAFIQSLGAALSQA